MTPAQAAYYERARVMAIERWKNPEYRKRVVKKQKELGYRSYKVNK